MAEPLSRSLSARFAIADADPAEAISTFSSTLFSLSERASRGAPERMLADAVALLQTSVPFDHAWWGEVSAATVARETHVWLCGSSGAEPGFVREVVTFSQVDRLAQTSIANLGTVINVTIDEARHKSQRVVDFCRRHRIAASLAITLEFPHSGMLFFVALHRAGGSGRFSASEAAFFGEYVKHLLRSWIAHLDVLRRGGAAPGWDSFALADSEGRLIYLGRRLCQALTDLYPHWRGGRLPDHLLHDTGSGTPRKPAAQGGHLAMERCGDLLALSLRAAPSTREIAPRELSSAILYARGHSYKEVARLLQIAPATVRSYLRNAYVHFGVSNKIELANVLCGENGAARHR